MGDTTGGGAKNMIPFSMFVTAMYALVKVLQLVWRGTHFPISQTTQLTAYLPAANTPP
jgi:hypothetical protein